MAGRKPFLLRIDPKLWAELEAWAKDDLRSINGQIEFLLKQAVLARRRKGGGQSVEISPGAPAALAQEVEPSGQPETPTQSKSPQSEPETLPETGEAEGGGRDSGGEDENDVWML